MFASCLTGKVHSTEEELLDDTYQHCRRSRETPPSDPNIRLKALLGPLLTGPHGKQMEQEMNKQCLSCGVDPTFWLTLTWAREDALRLADMAEYGLQCDAASTSPNRADTSIEVTASGLEQHKLGIANLSDYAADLVLSALRNRRPTILGQQSKLPHPPNVAVAQHLAMITPEHFTACDKPFLICDDPFDFDAREFAMSEPTRSNQHDSLFNQTSDSGYARSHAPTYQDHDSHFGGSSNRPQSVVMQDWPLSDNDMFKGDQSNYQHDSLFSQTSDSGYTRSHASTYQDHDSHFGGSSNRPQSVVMQDWPLSNNDMFKGDQSNYQHDSLFSQTPRRRSW
jgi:hypothetical protein